MGHPLPLSEFLPLLLQLLTQTSFPEEAFSTSQAGPLPNLGSRSPVFGGPYCKSHRGLFSDVCLAGLWSCTLVGDAVGIVARATEPPGVGQCGALLSSLLEGKRWVRCTNLP